MKWYKRDPDAALAGMIGLTLEERAIYNTVIDLLYSRNGDLPTDDLFFSRACECRPQQWRRLRDSLIAKGKLRYIEGGKLTANRVIKELKTARKLMAKSAETRSKAASKKPVSSEKSNHINGAASDETRADTPVRARKQPQPQPQPHPDSTEAIASAAAAASKPIYTDSKHELWGEGIPILMQLGVADRAARSNIGRWLRDTGNDAQRVLGAIQRARDNRIVAPIPWVTQALSTKEGGLFGGQNAAKTSDNRTGWQRRRDDQHEALAELGDYVDANPAPTRGSGGG